MIVALLVGACSSGGADDEPESAPNSATMSPTTSTTTSTTSAPVRPRVERPPDPPPLPSYEAAIGIIDASQFPHSWRPGCPVGPQSLRLVSLDYWGYDGVEHRGELVVHADHATAIAEVFRLLFDARFPIERMEPVDAFGGDDAASTYANNTASFNCRDAVGNPGVWSQHAFGAAIDVNPLVNPYVLGTIADPAYLDRTVDAPGLIRADDIAVQAFASIGWSWGGYWASPDYQHFSATGS